MTHEPINPYSAPALVLETARTSKGFTPHQCAMGFAAAGTMAGVVGGISSVYAASNGLRTTWILAFPGILLGLVLWISVARYIGGVAVQEAIGLVIGCLSGLACMGLVFDRMWSGFGRGPWTADTIVPVLFAPMIGMLIVAVTVRIVGGFVRVRMLVVVWLCGSLLGFAGFWSVLVLGFDAQRRDLAMVISMSCFQAGLAGLIGWQLGTSRSKLDADPDLMSGTIQDLR